MYRRGQANLKSEIGVKICLPTSVMIILVGFFYLPISDYSKQIQELIACLRAPIRIRSDTFPPLFHFRFSLSFSLMGSFDTKWESHKYV